LAQAEWHHHEWAQDEGGLQSATTPLLPSHSEKCSSVFKKATCILCLCHLQVEWATKADFKLMGWKWYEYTPSPPPKRGRSPARSVSRSRSRSASRSPSRSPSRSRSPSQSPPGTESLPLWLDKEFLATWAFQLSCRVAMRAFSRLTRHLTQKYLPIQAPCIYNVCRHAWQQGPQGPARAQKQ